MSVEDNKPDASKPLGPDSSAQRLKAEEVGQVAGRVADLADAGLPLASGLRALGEEVPSRRLRRTLVELSKEIEAGTPLDLALNRHAEKVPPYLIGLIRAGLQSGNLGLMMQGYLSATSKSRRIARDVWLSLAYSILLLSANVCICILILILIVPGFKGIFLDFGTELPAMTVALINLSDLILNFGVWILLGAVLFVGGARFACGLLGGAAKWRRLLQAIPVAGPSFRHSSLARYCCLLAVLLENGVRLPQALRMAGSGANDANIEEGSHLLAEQAEGGVPLDDVVRRLPHFPLSLAHVFRWERRQDTFPDALRAAAENFGARANVQTGLVAVMIEPTVILLVAVTVGGIVIALFMPLVKLLNDLS